MMTMAPLDRTMFALGWSLLHFVWQGAAVAALSASVSLLLRRASPQVRYLLASALSLAMLCCPVATFVALRAPRRRSRRDRWWAGSGGSWLALGARRSRRPLRGDASGTACTPRASLLPALVGLWAVGVLLLSLRSLGGWALVQRLRRRRARPRCRLQSRTRWRAWRVRRCGSRAGSPVRVGAGARCPRSWAGCARSILLPASALTGLSASSRWS